MIRLSPLQLWYDLLHSTLRKIIDKGPRKRWPLTFWPRRLHIERPRSGSTVQYGQPSFSYDVNVRVTWLVCRGFILTLCISEISKFAHTYSLHERTMNIAPNLCYSRDTANRRVTGRMLTAHAPFHKQVINSRKFEFVDLHLPICISQMTKTDYPRPF